MKEGYELNENSFIAEKGNILEF